MNQRCDLSGGGETIVRVPTGAGACRDGGDWGPPEETWLGRYAQRLKEMGLSSTARSVIVDDALYIAEKCVLGPDLPGMAERRWPSGRLRRGLVVGSVQSGKTASMLAVAAACLDRSVDVVVLLTGTRTALWRQTAQRTLSELDGWNEARDSDRRLHRVFLPAPRLINDDNAPVVLGELFVENASLVRRQLTRGRPLIAVVMKQSDHLMKFGTYLRNVLGDILRDVHRPIHLLLVDDEADDGSILDAQVEAALGPESAALKQIPRHIARIWAGSGPTHATFCDALYVTYMAYTATPQANFLQSDHNPLAPSDFVAALRTPYISGSVLPPRSTTYAEPLGVRQFYTGGEMFYRQLATGPGGLLRTVDFPSRREFASTESFVREVDMRRRQAVAVALRAYFVAAASSILLSGRSLAAARRMTPTAVETVRSVCPKPISMLVHPSARQQEHFEMADLIAWWSTGSDMAPDAASVIPRDELGRAVLDVDGLVRRLDAESAEWERWLLEYETSRQRILGLPGGCDCATANLKSWGDIREILVSEVFPYVRIAVINSDPRADDHPRFEPSPMGDGTFAAPVDVFTIFVSGNVLARGLTINGLVTSVFLRESDQPAADTQMQMQRWFGYRGALLQWCRVTMFSDQCQLFRAYHEADELLRREIIGEMNSAVGGAPSPIVLQDVGYRATGKIANLRNLPLCPGADPFVRVIETSGANRNNLPVLSKLMTTHKWSEVVAGGRVRGQIMNETLSLRQLAALLDEFRYSHHCPDPEADHIARWRALAHAMMLAEPLYRGPAPASAPAESVAPPSCPYSIAAYLRFWDAALSRSVRGIYPTDNRHTPWSMIDLAEYRAHAPQFYVGLRYGGAGPTADGELGARGAVRMVRQHEYGALVSTWGSRNPGNAADSYMGDQLFDYHAHGRRPPEVSVGEPMWRPRGEPGLVLFHIIALEGALIPETVTVGLALPLGGPDHFAALRPSSRSVPDERVDV